MKPPIMKKKKRRRRKPKFAANSKLSAVAKAAIERTARARAEIDAFIDSPDEPEEQQMSAA